MRIAFIGSSNMSPWVDDDHRFASMETACHRLGHEPLLLDAGMPVEERPFIAGLARESHVQPLIDAARLVFLVRKHRPDVCLVPLRGGLAHGLLMARACGELHSPLTILTLAEESSRSLALRSDLRDDAFRYIVADDMERFCLELTDALLVPENDELPWLPDPDLRKSPIIERVRGYSASDHLIVSTSEEPSDLVFVGPFDRTHGVDFFIDAAERLMTTTSLTRLAFIGPISEGHSALGREWLGRRALNWGFEFRVVETRSCSAAVDFILAAQALAFCPFASSGIRRRLAEASVESQEVAKKDASTTASLQEALLEGLHKRKPRSKSDDSRYLIRQIESLSCQTPVETASRLGNGISICVLHHDRPMLLSQALDSVLRQQETMPPDLIEIVVFDNGSRLPESVAFLETLAKDVRVKLVCAPHALAHPSAMNAMAAEATRTYLVFLDDDNRLAAGGLRALERAATRGCFDVVVSNLGVFDADASDVNPVAQMTFIGPARSSGLFFNGFGDTCMMFRQDSFRAIGGFLDIGADYPAPDWILLARAQGAGLAIGVLQEPAFLYRRDVSSADVNWRKYDQHGLRNLLLQHYGDRYDPALLARLSQTLVLTNP